MGMTVNQIDTTALFDAWSAAEAAAHQIIAPLKTPEDYQAALDTLGVLWEAKSDRPELGSLLGLLSERIKDYEEQVYPMPEVPAHQVLAFLMEQRGLTQSALARDTGIDQSNLSRLLKGERDFTTAHLRTLATYFHVPPSVFL